MGWPCVTHGRKYRVFWKNLNGGDRYEYSGHKHENNIDITDNSKVVGSGMNLSISG
jgi:hypothetical protein